MLPPPAPGEDPKDRESRGGPQSHPWALCWRQCWCCRRGELGPPEPRSYSSPSGAADGGFAVWAEIISDPMSERQSCRRSRPRCGACTARSSGRRWAPALPLLEEQRSSRRVLMAARSSGQRPSLHLHVRWCNKSAGSVHPLWMALSGVWAPEWYQVKHLKGSTFFSSDLLGLSLPETGR